ncbi:hypothetical protein OESDEN_16851, partial [Oesophagostomum dentatum]
QHQPPTKILGISPKILATGLTGSFHTNARITIGREIDSDERQRLVHDIERMTEDEQEQFIEFMEELLVLWQQLYHQTLPLLQSILYPLQRQRPEFDVRKTILTIFRDRVLSKVLAEVNVRIPILEPMLFT